MPRNPNSFRLTARNIFLTYPRCDVPKEEVLEMLLHLSWSVVKPNYIRVAREEHSDGSPHLHCLIQLSGKSNIKDAGFFDLTHPRRSARFHPNIQAAKDTNAVKNYITKEGDYCESGQYKVSGGSKSNKDDVAAQHSPKHDDYFNECSAARPRPTSIIIEGGSRTGKTMWARSLGPHNYLSGHLDFNSRVFSNDVKCNVIDDVAPHYLKLKHWKELIGAQRDWQSNCKYGKPVQIKGGIPSIVLCNPGEGSSYKDFLDKAENSALREWTEKNAKFIFLEGPLYQSTAQDC
uniref:Replication-associated protein n=1 Tax=Squash leaf curl virus TaxID=10829 RepID=A0A089NF98_SLCV|nr:AC1 [Squash leaf curl virus]